ncbi:MAG TPA: hypothetical protein VM101_04310 [Flavitalea sp.]|nr:hypothetical protein [Flavitalea sp.]
MYTEGFESLEEAERESNRKYGGSPDVDKLLRENDKLKKSLEKEKFFNKLLDQEIQELKSSLPSGKSNNPSDYWSGRKRVSRSAFFTLFFITLVMAGYIGYGFYYDKKFDYLELKNKVTRSHPPAIVDEPAPEDNSKVQTKTTIVNVPSVPAASNINAPAVKDSVPNIIGAAKNTTAEKQSGKQKAAVVITPDEEYNEDEVNATLREKVTPVNKNAVKSTPAVTAHQNTARFQSDETKPVIGRYRITSKANFYNSPDENTMRSTFISESANKTVNAFEEKNGFIYVVYTNDLGYTSRGWLSKKDLRKE